MKLFEDKTKEEHAISLAAFMPLGVAFEDKVDNEEVYGQFIEALACEVKRSYDSMNDLSEDYDILVTDELLEQWESAVGIPDGCFPATGTRAERRLHVLIKFAKMNVQTAEEFIELIELLGFSVELTPGADIGVFPLPFPIEFFGTAAQARYTIVVYLDSNNAVFPLPFPIEFASSANAIVECVLNLAKPANVEVLLRFTS